MVETVPGSQSKAARRGVRGGFHLLYVATESLGNRNVNGPLVEGLRRIPGVEVTPLVLGADDYRRYRVPRWRRWGETFEVRWMLARKLASEATAPFDAVITNTWEAAVEVQRFAPGVPHAAAMDMVPSQLSETGLEMAGFRGWVKRLVGAGHSHAFASAAKGIEQFLPWTTWCASALRSAYGVRDDECTLLLAPMDLERWRPGDRTVPGSPFRLLFVGNDFYRKGGDFLLRLYRERLAGTCTLGLASNDPALDPLELPPGVTLMRGLLRDALREHYEGADLFVFPTRSEMMGWVLAEALAMGLPCVAADVGGVGDLVRDGETGYLMPPGASIDQWAERIHSVRTDPGRWRRLRTGALEFAAERLDARRFQIRLEAVVARLRERASLPD